MRRTKMVFWVAAMVVGCDSDRTAGPRMDGGSAEDAAVQDGGRPTGDAGSGVDAGTMADAGSTADAGGTAPPPTCEPTSGTAMIAASCRAVAISVLRHGSAPTTVEMHADLTIEGDPCAVVETVEILTDGEVIQTLNGVPTGRTFYPITARASTADPRLAETCESDANRYDSHRIRIRGRTDGGTFEAECGDPSPASQSPPDSVVLCHEGLDHGPLYQGSSRVATYPTYVASEFSVSYLTDGDPAPIEALGDLVEVLPTVDPYSGADPVAPSSSGGWTGSVNMEGGLSPSLTVSMLVEGDGFGEGSCPASPSDPEDLYLPPLLMVRFSGSGPSGGFESEAFVELCDRGIGF